MPPERRVHSSPPRSPLAFSTSTSPSSSSSSSTSSTSSRNYAPTSLAHLPDSYISSYLSNRHAKEMMISKAQKRSLPNYKQQQHQPRAALQYNNRNQLTSPREAAKLPLKETTSQVSESLNYLDTLHHSIPISYPPNLHNLSPSLSSTINKKPRTQTSLPMFEHIDTKISSDHHHGYLPAALPSRVAKENLERLNQRIQRRRARAHETLFVDLHQGVKNVEAGVHRQVGMVLSRLKEAHASKYAFALTNSFLAQIPVTLSSTPSVTAEGSSTLAPHEEQANDSRPVNMMSKDLMVSEYLSKEFDSITLDKQSGLKQRPLQAAEEVETGKRSPLSISSSGASEVLSASMHTSYTTACSQVLSAALPSFIPSMVAPLVGVFSYPGPSTASNTSVENSNDRSTSKNSQQQLSKELNFPWGLPGCSSAHSTSPENNHRILHHQDLEPEVLDSGILICNSKPWTQAEREAVYLAVTRYHLLGQWSKIREMLNLHRTDEEIEAEYTKLYGHREGMTGISDDEDEKSLGDMDEDVDEESMISAVFMKIDGQQQYQNQQYQEIGVSQLGRDKRDGSEPIRIFKNELMINNHFTLEEIPTRL